MLIQFTTFMAYSRCSAYLSLDRADCLFALDFFFQKKTWIINVLFSTFSPSVVSAIRKNFFNSCIVTSRSYVVSKQTSDWLYPLYSYTILMYVLQRHRNESWECISLNYLPLVPSGDYKDTHTLRETGDWWTFTRTVHKGGTYNTSHGLIATQQCHYLALFGSTLIFL